VLCSHRQNGTAQPGEHCCFKRGTAIFCAGTECAESRKYAQHGASARGTILVLLPSVVRLPPSIPKSQYLNSVERHSGTAETGGEQGAAKDRERERESKSEIRISSPPAHVGPSGTVEPLSGAEGREGCRHSLVYLGEFGRQNFGHSGEGAQAQWRISAATTLAGHLAQ